VTQIDLRHFICFGFSLMKPGITGRAIFCFLMSLPGGVID